MHRRFVGLVVSLTLLAATAVGIPQRPAAAVTLPSGFQEQIVFSGLDKPTNIEFAPDGRIFVAEKRGTIKVFDDLSDPTPSLFADLTSVVNGVWDRGLLGMALHPDFPDEPWVYVLYTYDAPPWIETAPYWNDCRDIADPNNGECVVTGRLSRIQMDGAEDVLIRDWCQQYPSHSVGDLKFGGDGMLYVTSGDGAHFGTVDYGQFGNPCGDPVNEGGAFRSQDIRTPGDPTALNGAVLRLNPETGAAAADNLQIEAQDPNARRIVGYGLRNPYRFAIRPGTSEIWLGDVGWGTWEDIERLADPLGDPVNFGWPCYEGPNPLNYGDRDLCRSLYPPTGPGQAGPYFAYNHALPIVDGEDCATGGDAVGGMAFYPASGGAYPGSYAGALFFADYARGCIWAMKPTTAGGLPDPANIEAFAQRAAAPVDLEIGPGGELYYADHGGTVRRIRYYTGNQPPTAAFNVTLASGLAMRFDATPSNDNDPADVGRLTYSWDFGDGTTGTGEIVTHEYPGADPYTARLTVTDTVGAYSDTTRVVLPGNHPPAAHVDSPTTGLTWAVGDAISFTGRGTDVESGTIGDAGLSWQLRIQHCEVANSCHTHVIRSWNGVASGSFVAPDHEYPSYLELALTVTDPSGQTNTVVRRLDPKTVELAFGTSVPGLQLAAGRHVSVAPFTVEVIEGSAVTISATSPQQRAGYRYAFWFWSDFGSRTHVVTPTGDRRYRAFFVRCWGPSRFLVPDGCVQRAPIVRRPTPVPYRDGPVTRGRLPGN